VLCVLGDNGDGTLAGFGKALDAWASLFPESRKLVIAGNHDMYSGKNDAYTSSEAFYRELPAMANEREWEWLDYDSYYSKIGNVAIVGSIAWYDYSSAVGYMPSEYFAKNKKKFVADGKYITADIDDKKFSADRLNHLRTALRQSDQDASVEDVIVVTHVPIVEPQFDRKPDWELSNAYFGNVTTGMEVITYPKVRQIVSGHTHSPKSRTMGRQEMRDIMAITLAPGDIVVYDTETKMYEAVTSHSEYYGLATWNADHWKYKEG